MTDDARAALAAALTDVLTYEVDDDEDIAASDAAAIIAAMPNWRLIPADTSLAYDTGLQDGLLQAAELRRAALTSLRERVAGLRARHPDHVGGPEVQLGQVLAEIDRALGEP